MASERINETLFKIRLGVEEDLASMAEFSKTLQKFAWKGISRAVGKVASNFDGKQFGKTVGGILTGVGDRFTLNLKDIASNFISKFAETFDRVMSSSYLTNETTWGNVTRYGMTTSESYGFERAKEILGITNDEQMFRMTNTQWNTFMDLYRNYTDRYNQVYDSGVFDSILQFRAEWSMLMDDFVYTTIDWFNENEPWIMDIAETTKEGVELVGSILNLASPLVKVINWFSREVTSGVRSVVEWLRDRFGLSNGARISDTVRGVTQTTNKNVTYSASFTNVTSYDQGAIQAMLAQTVEAIANEMR